MREIDPLAVWYLAIFGVLVPYLAIKSSRRLRAGATPPPRKRIFINVVMMQSLFFFVAMFTAMNRNIPVFARGTVNIRALMIALTILTLALYTLPLRWRHTSEKDRQRLLISRPQAPNELGLWFLVSFAAGFVEEIAYRGVLLALLLPMTGSWGIAVAICVVLFALGHAPQGWPRAVFVGLVAIAMHLLVALTGTLFLAMAVHFLYDFLAGVFYVGLARRLGTPPLAPPPQATSA
jgi:membrane protease YdiL (CAAX protease family)